MSALLILRRLAGLVVVLAAIAGGAFCTSAAGLIVSSYWDASRISGIENRVLLFGAAMIGVLISYGLYRAGRWILR
ncbi:MAG TPA: hypothetical protein VNQ34_07365 [Xanthobacteraceae bacterium]|nr:hypothetical protein [Xanthobacteraceae bacterium]